MREGAGWPFYARPAAPGVTVTAHDVGAVLVRQDELRTRAVPSRALRTSTCVSPQRTTDPARLVALRAALAEGRQARVVARTADGPVGVGGYQAVDGVAELVGIATLPSVRRRGVAAAVSAELARVARARGHDVVFLSAQDDDVARVYERAGFRRLATACIAGAPGA